MCYTSASAARSTAKTALADGTLILLVPPLVFFALIGVVLYRYRNRFREISEQSEGPVIGRLDQQNARPSYLFDSTVTRPSDHPIHP
jgi:hypothetical protein